MRLNPKGNPKGQIEAPEKRKKKKINHLQPNRLNLGGKKQEEIEAQKKVLVHRLDEQERIFQNQRRRTLLCFFLVENVLCKRDGLL